VTKLLGTSEDLIALIADSGVETSDAPLIRVVIDTAKQIPTRSRPLSRAARSRLDQLMDEKYREIAGTDPKQYLTDYVAFTDRVLPPSRTRSRRAIRASCSASPGPKAAICRPTIRTTACRRARPGLEQRQLPQPPPVQRSRGEEGGGEHKAVPAADLPARHGRRQFRADEGPVVADLRPRPPLGRIPDGFQAG
jgi:methyl-accepting chemotaxis protein